MYAWSAEKPSGLLYVLRTSIIRCIISGPLSEEQGFVRKRILNDYIQTYLPEVRLSKTYYPCLIRDFHFFPGRGIQNRKYFSIYVLRCDGSKCFFRDINMFKSGLPTAVNPK